MNPRFLLAGALLLCGTGCVNISSVQRANTLGKGNLEIGLEPTTHSEGTPTFRPASTEAIVSTRYGLTDRLDLGARVGSPGAEVSAKLQLTPPENKRLVVSFAPQLAGYWLWFAEGWSLTAPLLVGMNFGEHQLILGPRVLYGAEHIDGTSTLSRSVYGCGSSVGAAIKVAEGVTLLPEYAFFLGKGSDWSTVTRSQVVLGLVLSIPNGSAKPGT